MLALCLMLQQLPRNSSSLPPSLQTGRPSSATSHWPHEYREAGPEDPAVAVEPATLSSKDLTLFGLSPDEVTTFLRDDV